MRSGRRNYSAGEVQVGERQQREHVRAVLGETAIAHLAIAELAHLYGPAARCKPKVMIWRSWSCASVSGLLTEPLSSWPSWISARVRSHSRLGPEGQMGHLITNALARPFSISSFRLADLGGKANSCFRDQLEPSAIRLVNLSAFIRLLPS